MAFPSNIPFTNTSSLSFAPIEVFNEQTKIAFGFLLETTRETNREQISLGQCQKMIRLLMELLPQRGVSEKDAKRKSWTRTNSDLVNRVFYRKPDKTHQQQKVLAEPEI